MVGRGQRVTVPPTAKLELALEVGAPEVIRDSAFREQRAARAMARPAAAPDQAVAIEHRVDGAFGRNPDIAVEQADQKLADFARTPMRLLGLEADDQGLDLGRQLIGIADRPPGAVAQRLQAMLPVPAERLKDLGAHHGSNLGPLIKSQRLQQREQSRRPGASGRRTSFAPETTSTKHNERDRNQRKTQQNQRS
jgi:hypothetical protein